MVNGVQQPNYPIIFSLNPSVFPINSNVSTLACVTVTGTATAIAIHQNDIFGLIFDPAVGTLSLPPSPTVTLTTNPTAPAANPAATAADFTVTQGSNPNKIVITYTNQATQNLRYGTNICTQINIATASTPGTGTVRVASQLSTMNGNLPTINFSLVDFATSRGSYSFMSAISIPNPGSFFTPLTGFGDSTGMNTGQGTTDGFGVAAAPMSTACTFDSLQVSATCIPIQVTFPYTFTLWKNDAATALTCGLTTDTGAGTVACSDTTHTVPVVAGDMMAVQVVQPGFAGTSPAGTFGISLHCK
jgi:hypothetical protein